MTVLVRRKGSSRYRTLRTVHTNSPGLLDPQLEHRGTPLAGALDEPRRRRATKARRSAPTDGAAPRPTGRRAPPAPLLRWCGDAGAARGRDHRPPAGRGDRGERDRVYARAPGINALKTFDPPIEELVGERVAGRAPPRQAPDRRNRGRPGAADPPDVRRAAAAYDKPAGPARPHLAAARWGWRAGASCACASSAPSRRPGSSCWRPTSSRTRRRWPSLGPEAWPDPPAAGGAARRAAAAARAAARPARDRRDRALVGRRDPVALGAIPLQARLGSRRGRS